MSKYVLKCEECGNLWEFKASYDLSEFSKLYHYCSVCKKNTFHIILTADSAEVHTITDHS